MINAKDFDKKVMSQIDTDEFNLKDGNEQIEQLNSIIKDYTCDKLSELGLEKSNDISLIYLLHLLSDMLNEEERDCVFDNYTYTLLNILGKLQKCGIVLKYKKDNDLGGIPKAEIDDEFKVSTIQVDESCTPVNNTIYVHKMLIKKMRK